MATRRTGGRRRRAASLIFGGLAGASALTMAVGGAGQAHAAGNPTAFFALKVLTVIGTSDADTIVISRDAAGTILVNNGAVTILGGNATVANTNTINVLGLGGNDTLTFDEANGALPKAVMFGGGGDDTMTSGSGTDLLIGQGGNDAMFGKGANDRLFGSGGNDSLTGGDLDDQAFGEAGDDTMIWNPGEDNDLNEGGAGVDTTVVNGGGNERFTATANGARVRFDRVDPAPFFVDMGTTEKLQLNAGNGDDSFSTVGDLAALVAITVDGGAGNDTLLGSNGIDVMLGGDGNDFLDGQQGNDVGFLGAGDDTFQWDPGDGSDIVEGQDGRDRMLFNGSGGAEIFDTSANGGRVRFFRNLGNINMDLDDVEVIDLNALAGADALTINDVSGTDLVEMNTDLANPAGTGTPDADGDTVIVNATNGGDVIVAAGENGALRVEGLAAVLDFVGASPANDRITINARNGDDVLDASGMTATTMALTANMGDGDDVAIGGEGNDTLNGDAGDDVLLGGPGTDTVNGGDGDDIEIDAENLTATEQSEDQQWVEDNTREMGGQTILEANGTTYEVPAGALTA